MLEPLNKLIKALENAKEAARLKTEEVRRKLSKKSEEVKESEAGKKSDENGGEVKESDGDGS